MKALVLAPDCPFPPRHGGRLDAWNRAAALERSGAAVTIVTTTDNAAEVGTYQVHGVTIHCTRRDFSPIQLMSLRPFQYNTRRQISRHLPRDMTWDIAIMETLYFQHFAPKLRQSARALVLRQHNFEPRYLSELASCDHSLARQLYLRAESAKAALTQISDCPSISQYWCISEEETVRFAKQYGAARTQFTPPCFPEEAFGYAGTPSRNLCFVGRLDGPDTTAALGWYFRQVHPHLSEESAVRLTIAGRVGGQLQMEVPPGVNCIQNPADVTHILRDARAMIVPIRGVTSGTKMKVVEALCAGIEIITTPEGASGLPRDLREELSICESADEFRTSIGTIFGMSPEQFATRRIRRLSRARAAFSELNYTRLVDQILVRPTASSL